MPGRAGGGDGTVPGLLLGTVVLLGSVGPLATDMYLPAFPHVLHDLGTSQSALNLTLTAFFAGMATGQLVGGPVSDQFGRRRPLLLATIGLLLASIGCAMAPNIGVMLVARLLSGLFAGWGMVIGRAVLIDLTGGPRLVKMMNLIMAIGSIAPLVAPLLGALLIQTLGWRFAFWAIALLAAVQTAGAVLVVPESLPPAKRHSGGLRTFGHNARRLVRRRTYMGYVLVTGFASIALFAYVAQSSLVLQTLDGLSPTQYSLVFATNSLGIVLATTTSARLAGRVETRRVVLTGQALQVFGGVLVLMAVALFGLPLWLVWPGFFALTVGQGLIGGNAAALASGEATDMAGTGSALVGVAQSGAASLSPVLVSLMGAQTAWPVALLMTSAPLCSLASLLLVARRRA